MVKRAATPKRQAKAHVPRPPVKAPAADLDSMSVRELTALIDRATKLRDRKMGSARQEFIDKVKTEAAALGIPLGDLMPARQAVTKATGKTAGRRSPAVKYRGPNGETWTGRGRTPTWLTAYEAEGRKRDEFLVSGAK